jgi:[ribosomal protein S5]-alanine N-acetyltransferase
MDRLTIKTPRLELSAGSAELLRLEWAEPARFAETLDVRFPSDWPPGLYDEDARRYFEATYAADPNAEDWLIWYVIKTEGRTLIGAFGFVAPPDAEGQVVMGYSVSTDYRRQGYATEAVGGLLRWAFEDVRVKRIVADTFPDLVGSIGVLRNNGFAEIGPGPEEGAIRFRLDREHWELRKH